MAPAVRLPARCLVWLTELVGPALADGVSLLAPAPPAQIIPGFESEGSCPALEGTGLAWDGAGPAMDGASEARDGNGPRAD